MDAERDLRVLGMEQVMTAANTGGRQHVPVTLRMALGGLLDFHGSL